MAATNRGARRVGERLPRRHSTRSDEGALQTRKWTDNSGQERYTSEVVLQRFRGELTMLDGAGGARGAGGPPTEAGYDEGFGDEPRALAAAMPARGRTPVNGLVYDIPI
jgi:single-strand DNA-binding protein